MSNEMIIGKIEFAPSATGAKSPTDWYAHWKRQSELNAKLMDALRDVLEICRQWEPDYSSGKDRRTLSLARELLTPNGVANSAALQRSPMEAEGRNES